jgi:hypothetical protein
MASLSPDEPGQRSNAGESAQAGDVGPGARPRGVQWLTAHGPAPDRSQPDCKEGNPALIAVLSTITREHGTAHT